MANDCDGEVTVEFRDEINTKKVKNNKKAYSYRDFATRDRIGKYYELRIMTRNLINLISSCIQDFRKSSFVFVLQI